MINKQTEGTLASNFDWFKWAIVVALIAAGVWANYHYARIDWALRLAGWILLACFLLLITLQTTAGRVVWRFIKDARMELRKVVWPTRPETVQTTMIVAAMVIVVSLILWGLDSIFLWFVGLLTGQ